uniref:Uncharacterized protein n=1 Tax=viral metagenome TaxID=1070528 RepID=A0A6M3LN88_9ZZZZ
MTPNLRRKTDKLTATTIIVLIVQAVAILWFVFKVDSRSLANTEWIKENKAITVAVARIEEKLEGFGNQFDKFSKRIDRFMETR